MASIKKCLSEDTNTFDPSKKEEHIGLYNCYMRLKLFFGDKFSFHIASREGEGTSVVIDFKD